ADAAESATETKPDANAPAASAPTEEGDVGRRPDRLVAWVHAHGTGPPDPITAVNEPAAVVVWRPAPWLVGNPRPSVVRVINPAAGAIRGPAWVLPRSPHRTVIRDFGPDAVIVQIFRADVVRI